MYVAADAGSGPLPAIARPGSSSTSCTSTTSPCARSCRRQGLAALLLTHVLEEATAVGASRATLEVRRSNDGARRLYERFGFRVAGVRRDYYTDPAEDALILWREEASGTEGGEISRIRP